MKLVSRWCFTLLVAVSVVNAEPVNKPVSSKEAKRLAMAAITDEAALVALKDITEGRPIRDLALYHRALQVFDGALRNPRYPLGARPEFLAILKAVKALPSPAFGPDKPLFHFRDNQPAALRVLLDWSANPADLRAAVPAKHPSADLYPGLVPPDAARLSESIAIDTNRYGWISTGLYAPAGERVTIVVPDGLVGKRIKIRIGANTAALCLWADAGTKLTRFPKIDGDRVLTTRVTEFGNAFGGPIYLDLPDRPGFDRGKADCISPAGPYVQPKASRTNIRISGAVRMPYFVLGQTRPATWKTTLRDLPAPIAEWATDKIIFTLPAKFIRTVDDPSASLQTWDKLQDANAWLSGRSETRPMPMRVAIDAAVKYGEAYATYPICAPFYWTPPIVAGKPGWGHAHEIGHLHQRREWTFQGCGEVTVNLFSMYALSQTAGDTNRQHALTSSRSVEKWFKQTPAERDWTRNGDVWGKLSFYCQLVDAFGWEPLRDVLAGYRAKPFQGDDVARGGEFMLRLSKRLGKNMAPFFKEWGVQFPASCVDQVNTLPVWMPTDHNLNRNLNHNLPDTKKG